jgi:hypothetical protein
MRLALAFLRRHLLMTLVALVLLTVLGGLWIPSAPITRWVRIVGSLVVLAVAALIWIPKCQVARLHLTSQERFTAENEARKTLAQIIGGAAVLAGLYFTWSSLEVSREGQVTERFTKAIDHLGAVNDDGEKQLENRLGGIHALERIARDSERDHWPIMEILTAYVREHAPWPPKPPKDTPPPQDHPSSEEELAAAARRARRSPPKLAIDIQAILTVLGRRVRSYEKEDQRLNIAETDLRRADLRGADPRGAHLERAILRAANLEWADLTGIHLEGADLTGTYLDWAIFRGAHLQGANFAGVYFEHVRHLTVEQICLVRSLDQVQSNFPSGLLEQIQHRCPKILEPD